MTITNVTTGVTYATVSESISNSSAGDVIQVSAGTYSEDFPKITHSLTIQGVGGLAQLTPIGSPSNGEGILVIDAPDVTLDHLELSGATVPDGNGAGIRFETGTNLMITHCWVHDNQDGLLANSGSGTTITIDHSEFDHNGANDGFTHNLYVNAVNLLTITDSYFHDALGGHEIKSRALQTVISDNRIADGPTSDASYSVDLPNGGAATITGNVIEKGPDSPNSSFVHFGGELFPVYVPSSLEISDNVVINDRAGLPDFLLNQALDSLSAPVTATVENNTFYGMAPDDLGNSLVSLNNAFPGGTAPVVDTTHPFAVPCFVIGTMIAVPGGEIPVEQLRIGDPVTTAAGVAATVKWLGRRCYTAERIAAHAQLQPVLIRRHAIAAGLPRRDLRVSPLHAVLVDSLLVPAASLVNGVSVLREHAATPVCYVHVELDRHDIILAEGLPAETFVDDDSRMMFDNADEYFAIYPTGSRRGPALARTEQGRSLEGIRRRVAARAGIACRPGRPGPLRGHVERLTRGVLEGWVFDTDRPGEPVELEIRAPGFAATIFANRYRADLDHHGLAGGCAGFTLAVPTSVAGLDQVSVRRIGDRARVPQAPSADTATTAAPKLSMAGHRRCPSA